MPDRRPLHQHAQPGREAEEPQPAVKEGIHHGVEHDQRHEDVHALLRCLVGLERTMLVAMVKRKSYPIVSHFT